MGEESASEMTDPRNERSTVIDSLFLLSLGLGLLTAVYSALWAYGANKVENDICTEILSFKLKGEDVGTLYMNVGIKLDGIRGTHTPITWMVTIFSCLLLAALISDFVRTRRGRSSNHGIKTDQQ
jgi:hypothetical protein